MTNTVPIITVTGLSKRFLVPGWRFGWVALHDPSDHAPALREGFDIWANRIFGPNSAVQAALPEILNTPTEWFDSVLAPVKRNAEYIHALLNSLPGVSCSKIQGALYALVKLDPAVFGIAADVKVCQELYDQQAVFVLPGVTFNAPGHFRLVLACPEHIVRDLSERFIEYFTATVQRA